MFKQKCAVLIILAAAVFAFSATVFAADQASKDAILQELSGFADKNPDVLRSVVYSMADEYQRNNEADKAIALFEKAVKVLPENEDMLARLGDLYTMKSDYAKAAEAYKKTTELKPDIVWYYQRLSDAYINAGDIEKAKSVWQSLTQKLNTSEAYMQAANFYSSQNDMIKAIEAAKKAADMSPDSISYLQNLESFYVRAEKYDEAEKICNKVLTGAKEQWAKDWASSETINIYQRQNRLTELATKFEKDLASTPTDLPQYRKLAELYQRSDQRDKAIDIYEKAIAAGIADRDIEYRVLDLYEWAEKFDKAEAQLNKIINASPQGENSYLYERLAGILERAGKKDAAKKAWMDFLAKAQNDAGAFVRYGDKLSNWGDVDGAVAQYRKAMSLDPNNMWYNLRVADILINNNKIDEAKKELNNIIAKAKEQWPKDEAKRRLSDIEIRPGAPEIIFEEAKEGAKKEAPKKKRGWFGR